MLLQELLGVIGVGLLCVAAGYETVASLAVLIFELRRAVALRVASGRVQQPVTVLKPLCGAEPGLYENLRSFCLQKYGNYQIVFGIQDEADPALDVVETEDTIEVTVDVSGVQAEALRILFRGGVLVVAGEKAAAPPAAPGTSCWKRTW